MAHQNVTLDLFEQHSLLDEVGCTVIEEFQKDQRHLMLKVSLKGST